MESEQREFKEELNINTVEHSPAIVRDIKPVLLQ